MTDVLLDKMLKMSTWGGASTQCRTCALLADLVADGKNGEATLNLLKTALETKRITATAIAKVMQEEGHRISDSSVRRHRRGGCLTGQSL